MKNQCHRKVSKMILAQNYERAHVDALKWRRVTLSNSLTLAPTLFQRPKQLFVSKVLYILFSSPTTMRR